LALSINVTQAAVSEFRQNQNKAFNLIS